MYRTLVPVLLAGLALSGCGSSSPAGPRLEDPNVLNPHAVLLHEGYSGFDASQRFVVRDPETWANVWARAYAHHVPVPPVPAVDFSEEMVVVAALGTRPSGGYDITIERLVTDSGLLRVFVEATVPGRACFTTAAITQPVVAVRVRALAERVDFQERIRTSSCR